MRRCNQQVCIVDALKHLSKLGLALAVSFSFHSSLFLTEMGASYRIPYRIRGSLFKITIPGEIIANRMFPQTQTVFSPLEVWACSTCFYSLFLWIAIEVMTRMVASARAEAG